MLGPTSAAVARYDGMLSAIPNPDILLSPLTTQEAVLSSRIEGTQATIEDVLGFEAGRQPDSLQRQEDIQEVLNYRNAMRQAQESLKGTPVSQVILRDAHAMLLDSVRGAGHLPGKYREEPNWIGRPGCSIDEARFVPIDYAELTYAMDAWEHYSTCVGQDRLVQLAILHAEFEALHPFLDGNGRLGRMLIPLFLWKYEFIQAPTFYVSAYFEADRNAYYDSLLAVSSHDDWTEWIEFFLRAVRAQAEDNWGKAQEILDLYEQMKVQVPNVIRSQHAIHALDTIFERPILNAPIFIMRTGIANTTARRILGKLREGGILRPLFPRQGRAPEVLVFGELLNIVEGREIF